MNNRKWLVIAFVLVALVQLYVPAKMILMQEDILSNGSEFKFKTAPIDPNDPFRGKYITLRYEQDRVQVKSESEWKQGETVYVLIDKDSRGLARFQTIMKDKPVDQKDFLETQVSYVSTDGSNVVFIDLPFDRFYMEESTAYDAEVAYAESRQDTTQLTCAVVNIKNGNAVLKDVVIDGVSIRDVVKARQEAKP